MAFHYQMCATSKKQYIWHILKKMKYVWIPCKVYTTILIRDLSHCFFWTSNTNFAHHFDFSFEVGVTHILKYDTFAQSDVAGMFWKLRLIKSLFTLTVDGYFALLYFFDATLFCNSFYSWQTDFAIVKTIAFIDKGIIHRNTNAPYK
jgi:hypothetical protein